MKTSKILSFAMISVLLLCGCANSNKPFGKFAWPKWGTASKTASNADASCPQAALMPDLGNLTQMRDKQVISETVFDNIKTSCTEAPGVETVRLAIAFKGRLGPQGVKDAAVEATYSLPYLVAVVNPKGEIISKDIFAFSLTYKKGQVEQSYNDLLEQTIPLQKGEKAKDYKIMLGFQLTDDELAYNRAMSVKSPAK